MNITQVFESPVGRIAIKASENGVCRILLRPTERLLRSLGSRSDASTGVRVARVLGLIRAQLEQYFSGGRVTFDVPLDMSSGTSFQQKVWRACRQIPYGQVRSYSELAEMVICPRGARAVGGAIAANPLPIVVPCHRVIRSDGSPGGYRHGLTLKKKLLRLESGAGWQWRRETGVQ